MDSIFDSSATAFSLIAGLASLSSFARGQLVVRPAPRDEAEPQRHRPPMKFCSIAAREVTACTSPGSSSLLNALRQIESAGRFTARFSKVSGVQLVDTTAKLQATQRLLQAKPGRGGILSIDLEHHHRRSYSGFVPLVQLSWYPAEEGIAHHVVLDTTVPAVRAAIPELLGPLLQSERVVKLFHALTNDIKWLREDFGLRVAHPVLDTSAAARVLGEPKLSLAALSSKYIGYTMDKQWQASDWRVRPLPAAMLQYANDDSAVLLPLLRRLLSSIIKAKEVLQDKGKKKDRRFKRAAKSSNGSVAKAAAFGSSGGSAAGLHATFPGRGDASQDALTEDAVKAVMERTHAMILSEQSHAIAARSNAVQDEGKLVVPPKSVARIIGRVGEIGAAAGSATAGVAAGASPASGPGSKAALTRDSSSPATTTSSTVSTKRGSGTGIVEHHPRVATCFVQLLRWRLVAARALDESDQFLCRDADLARIAVSIGTSKELRMGKSGERMAGVRGVAEAIRKSAPSLQRAENLLESEWGKMLPFVSNGVVQCLSHGYEHSITSRTVPTGGYAVHPGSALRRVSVVLGGNESGPDKSVTGLLELQAAVEPPEVLPRSKRTLSRRVNPLAVSAAVHLLEALRWPSDAAVAQVREAMAATQSNSKIGRDQKTLEKLAAMAMDRPLYDNLQLRDVSGSLLCHISKRRAAWYIARGLVYVKPQEKNKVVRKLQKKGSRASADEKRGESKSVGGVASAGGASDATPLSAPGPGELDTVDIMRGLGFAVKDPDLMKKRADAFYHGHSTKEDDDGFLYVPEDLLEQRKDERVSTSPPLDPPGARSAAMSIVNAGIEFMRMKRKARGKGMRDDPYHLKTKTNSCVCCGSYDGLSRLYVVPRCYRIHFPAEAKSRTAHDVLLCCVKCRPAAVQAQDRTMRWFAEYMLVPRSRDMARSLVHAVPAKYRAYMLPRERVLFYERTKKQRSAASGSGSIHSSHGREQSAPAAALEALKDPAADKGPETERERPKRFGVVASMCCTAVSKAGKHGTDPAPAPVADAVQAYIRMGSPPGVRVLVQYDTQIDEAVSESAGPARVPTVVSMTRRGSKGDDSVQLVLRCSAKELVHLLQEQVNPLVGAARGRRKQKQHVLEAWCWQRLFVFAGIVNLLDDTTDGSASQSASSGAGTSGGAAAVRLSDDFIELASDDDVVNMLQRSVGIVFSKSGHSPTEGSPNPMAPRSIRYSDSSALYSAQVHGEQVVRMVLNGPRAAEGMSAFSPWFMVEAQKTLQAGKAGRAEDDDGSGSASADGEEGASQTWPGPGGDLYESIGLRPDPVVVQVQGLEQDGDGGGSDRSAELSAMLKGALPEAEAQGASGLPEGLERRITWFVREWRRQFVEAVEPKHLPDGWSVDYRVVRSRVTDRL